MNDYDKNMRKDPEWLWAEVQDLRSACAAKDAAINAGMRVVEALVNALENHTPCSESVDSFEKCEEAVSGAEYWLESLK